MKNLMTVLILALSAFGTTAFATAHKEAPDMTKGASAPMGSKAATAESGAKPAHSKSGAKAAHAASGASAAHAASGAVVAASGSKQQNKMKACNNDPIAKSTKGDERKAFMKECLSK